MVIHQRAIQAGDKEQRHHAILDAAKRLLLRSPERASMAEIAAEAGLAKGTLYLYFPSKEELLLALHERDIDSFFGALMALLEESRPISFADVFALTRAHVVAPPLFLPLASRCFSAMAQQLPPEVARAFKLRMDERLERAGAALGKHLPALRVGAGVALLRHHYALILGLWQMCGGNAAREATFAAQVQRPVFVSSHLVELQRAPFASWQGTVAEAAAAR